MITISCSILEKVRLAPALHGQTMATITKKIMNGKRGMFGCWQDVAKLVHEGVYTPAEGVNELEKRFFVQFLNNARNSKVQARLLDKFPRYCAEYAKLKFELVDGRHQMKWDLVSGVRLTGFTPWVVHNKSGYFSFIHADAELDWQNQLRFPLIQKYLADNHIECDLTDMNVGIYCLETNSFDFKNYSAREIQNRIVETGNIFRSVLTEYQKWKK